MVDHPLAEIPNADQNGLRGVPVFNIIVFNEVLKMTNPVAGKIIAFCWEVVIRGIKNPVVVLLTSSIALVSALLPVEFIDTFWANNVEDVAEIKMISKEAVRFFM